MRYLSLACFIGILLSAAAQPTTYRFGFYNVENLFHPENDSLTNDDEFTPEGGRFWNYYKYRAKYHRMAKVILSMGEDEPVDILGLAEVENRQVVEDMVNSRVLSKLNYAVIHKNSPDRRGIDVAAIYRPERVKILDTIFIRLSMPDNPNYASRDMLYLKALTKKTLDTVHFIYCHWPSRYGGQAISEPKRIQAAKILKAFYDSVMAKNPAAKFIITGDFNDEHFNASLHDYLKAGSLKQSAQNASNSLFNLMIDLPATEGSHRYQGEWTYLDQIIINNTIKPNLEQFGTIRHNFLLEQDEKYPGLKPFRTFVGFKHNGGFSDHLPIFIDLNLFKSKTQP